MTRLEPTPRQREQLTHICPTCFAGVGLWCHKLASGRLSPTLHQHRGERP